LEIGLEKEIDKPTLNEVKSTQIDFKNYFFKTQKQEPV